MSRFSRKLARKTRPSEDLSALNQNISTRLKAQIPGIQFDTNNKVAEELGLPMMSEQLLNFATLLAPLKGTDGTQARALCHIAVVCWNVGLLYKLGQDKLADEQREKLNTLFSSAEAPPETRRGIDQLIEERQTLFASDPRLILTWEIQENGGQRQLVCGSVVPPGARG